MDSFYETEDDDDTVPCPNCGTDIYEDAEQCPSCGEYITHSTRLNPHWRQTSTVLLALAVITAILYALALLTST